MTYLKNQVTITSSYFSDEVSQIEISLKDSSTLEELMRAKMFLFKVGRQYPTEYLSLAEAADIWLIQEDLDELIAANHESNQWVGWIDCVEKLQGADVDASKELNSLLKSTSFKTVLESFGIANTLSIYLHPYPLNVCDEEQARIVQKKLMNTYSAKLNAKIAYKNLMCLQLD